MKTNQIICYLSFPYLYSILRYHFHSLEFLKSTSSCSKPRDAKFKDNALKKLQRNMNLERTNARHLKKSELRISRINQRI